MAKEERKGNGISSGTSKLRQSSSDFTLKQELEPAVIACLAGRDVPKVLYVGFLRFLSGIFVVVLPISVRARLKLFGEF